MGVRPHGAPGYVLAWTDTTGSTTCVGDNIYEARGLDLTLPVKEVRLIRTN